MIRAVTRAARALLALALTAALVNGCGRAAAGAAPSASEARVVTKAVEDVFLLTGELRAVRSESLVTPRGEGELQIRWMAEDGAEVKEGERVAEFDPTRLVQTIEERRLRLRQTEIDRESRERSAEAERERKRVAVEKAEVEAEKARLDAEIPLEYRDPIDRPRIRAQWQQAKAALEKARLEREAYAITSRADVAAARAAEDKARREVEASEKALGSMSLAAPTSGIFLVGELLAVGPGGPAQAAAGRHGVAGVHGRVDPRPVAHGGGRLARRVRPRAHRARPRGALHPRHVPRPGVRGPRRGDRLGRGRGRRHGSASRAAPASRSACRSGRRTR